MRHLCRFLMFISFVAATSSRAETYWQLMISYSADGMTVLEAGAIQPMVKEPRTPGLTSAPARLTYRVEWYEGQNRVFETSIGELPLGIRSPFEDGRACEALIPESGILLVRFSGPEASSRPTSLRFVRQALARNLTALPLPPVFEQNEINVPVLQVKQNVQRIPGPKSSAKVRDTGPDNNRLVVVVVGDGYTAANLTAGEFTTDAANLVTAFEGRSPWDVIYEGTNVYRVDIESNEEGADNDPTQGVSKDTYLNSQFWTFNIERLLTIDNLGITRAYQAADLFVGIGVWDHVFVLVNSTKYGGSGGPISVSSVHSLAAEIIIHEFGHTFAGLSDEYEDPYPGFPPGDGEPNVDFDFSGPALKWLVWVNGGTPLPTPETPTYANVVGAFEGARFLSSGIYRPRLNCMMRQLNVPFCEVCKEAHVQEFSLVVEYADATSPATGSSHYITPSGTTFTITPIPVPGLAYSWQMNGVTITGATGPSVHVTSNTMKNVNSPTQAVLRSIVSFPTALVRQPQEKDTLTWTVLRDCNGNGIRDDTDIILGTSFDTNGNGIPDECDTVGCCLGSTGNIDCDAENEVDISDLTVLIDHLFINLPPLCCPPEANTDADAMGQVDISDLTALIDHLYIDLEPLPGCL